MTTADATRDEQRQQLALARAKADEVRRAKAEDTSPTTREARFALHWVMTLNATASAIRAGYSAHNAEQQAWKLMRRPRVKALIRRLQDRYSNDLEVNIHRVLREVCSVAFLDPSNFIDPEGRIEVSAITPEQMRAVSEIISETYVDGKGNNAEVVKRVKLKFHPKMQALETLAKHLGLFEQDNLQKAVKAQIVVFAGHPDAGSDHGVVDVIDG